MKTAISIPDDLFRAAEALARRLGVSRSGLYQRAIASYLERHDEARVTVQLDRIHAGDDTGTVDPVLEAMQRRILGREDWCARRPGGRARDRARRDLVGRARRPARQRGAVGAGQRAALRVGGERLADRHARSPGSRHARRLVPGA